MSKIGIYRVATSLILGGFAFLCQPWSLSLFSAGFPVLLAGVVIHIVLDHWPDKANGAEPP